MSFILYQPKFVGKLGNSFFFQIHTYFKTNPLLINQNLLQSLQVEGYFGIHCKF